MVFWINIQLKEWVEERVRLVGGAHEFRMVLDGQNPFVCRVSPGGIGFGEKTVPNIRNWELEYIGDKAGRAVFETAVGSFVSWLDERNGIERGGRFDEVDMLRAVLSDRNLSAEEFWAKNPLPVYSDDGMRVVRRRVFNGK